MTTSGVAVFSRLGLLPIRHLKFVFVVAASVGLANCGTTGPTREVTQLHATGLTNSNPPTVVDLSIKTGTTTGGQQAIDGTFSGTVVGASSFQGRLSGNIAGSFDKGGDGGNFDGTLTTTLPDGCTAARSYTGRLSRTTMDWVAGQPANTCGGASPLIFDLKLPVDVEPVLPATVSVSVQVSPTSASHASGAQTGSTQVTANASWTAASNSTFLTITSGGTGGSGTTALNYSVQANSGAARTAVINVAHGDTIATFTVNQAAGTVASTLSITAASPAPAVLTAASQTGTATVTASNVTTWSSAVSSDAPWLTISSGGSGGSGNTTLTYSAQANPGTSSRSGTITISGTGATPATLTVTQVGTAPTPIVTIVAASPSPAVLIAAAQTGTATVTASNVTTWSSGVSSDAPWLTISSGGSGGSGSTTLTYSAQANPGTSSRSGTITISATGATPATLSVTQAGTTPTPIVSIVATSPSPASLTAAAQSGTATVTAANVSTWSSSVSSDAPWLTISSGGSGGSGSTTLTYAAQANPGTTSRSGTITIAATGATSATLTVTQNGAASLSIAPTTAPISETAQNGTAMVTAVNLTGSWAANVTSNSPWLTFVSGSTGGNGTTTLTYSAQANSGSSRIGTITVSATGVSSVTLTVTQAAGASIVLFPSTQSNPPFSSTGTISVMASNLSSWTAVIRPNEPWLSIQSGGSGTSGSSVFTYTFGPNFGPIRTGFIDFISNGATLATLTVMQSAGSSPLVFTFNPNPAHRTTGTCTGVTSPNFWSYQLTIQNTGSSAFTVTAWAFDVPGEFHSNLTATDFVNIFGGSNIAAGGSRSAFLCVRLSNTSGSVTNSFTDNAGNTLTTSSLTLLSSELQAVGAVEDSEPGRNATLFTRRSLRHLVRFASTVQSQTHEPRRR